MIEVERLHREAMGLADAAMAARLRGNADEAARLTRDSYLQEREAASLVADRLDFEPTRAVLHRSAATLAIECGELADAVDLLRVALAGKPPDYIAAEVRELLRELHCRRARVFSSAFGADIGQVDEEMLDEMNAEFTRLTRRFPAAA